MSLEVGSQQTSSMSSVWACGAEAIVVSAGYLANVIDYFFFLFNFFSPFLSFFLLLSSSSFFVVRRRWI